ncbi:MAG: amidohydrolase family protein [Alphaproteobacteria bacterium]
MKNLFKILAVILFLPTVAFAQEQAPEVKPEVKALVGGTLIDGFSSIPIQNSVIIIEGDTIVAVGTVDTLAIPEGAEIISTEGMSVMPGLWENHAHLMITGHADYAYWDPTYRDRFVSEIMPASALQLLMAGITSARDLGAPLADSIEIKRQIAAGEIPGPRLFVSGPFIQHQAYPGTEEFRWGVNGVRDARAKVNQLADAGVDIIKLIDQDQMTMEEVYAVVDQAHKRGLIVVAHGHRPEEVIRGLLAGVDNFEHTGFATAPEYPKHVMDAIKERTAQMNLGPLYWTPTVEGLYNYTYNRDHPEKLDNTCWHLGLEDSTIADIKASIENPDRLPYFQITPQRMPTLKRKISQLREAGVVILIGTDSGIPMKFHCQSTWNELDILVRVMGMDPMDAIKGATYWPSVLMGVSDEVGTVSEGKLADIIAVKGDVLRYINLLSDVDIVIQGGKVVKKRYK